MHVMFEDNTIWKRLDDFMNEFDSPNYTEFSYEAKAEGKIKIMRILAIIGYVAFVAAYFLVCYITRVIPAFAIAPIFTWILIFFTWSLVKFDYISERDRFKNEPIPFCLKNKKERLKQIKGAFCQYGLRNNKTFNSAQLPSGRDQMCK